MANASLLKLWGLLFGSTDQNDASVEKILENLGLTTALAAKQPLDPTLTALAALVGVANKLPYFNGGDTAALTDLTQVGRDIIGKSTIADILTYLQLGEAANRSVGNGANQIPDMSYFTTGEASSGRWAKLPSGLIIQAGFRLTDPSGSATVNLPIPFTGTFFVVGGSAQDNVPAFVGVRGLTQSTISVITWGSNGAKQVINMHWLAIGV